MNQRLFLLLFGEATNKAKGDVSCLELVVVVVVNLTRRSKYNALQDQSCVSLSCYFFVRTIRR